MATPAAPLPEGTPPAPEPVVDKEARAMQQQLVDRFDDLQRRIASASTPPPPQPAPGDMAAQKAAVEKQFWQNPLDVTATIAQRAAFEAANAAVNQMRNEGMQNADTLIDVARSKARERNPKLFDRFVAEIETKVGLVHPQYRQNINVWVNAMNAVFGENLETINREQAAAPPAASVVSDGPAPPSARAPAAPRKEALTAEEQQVASKLKISDDQYRQAKKDYADQDGQGPSCWDNVVTFDSDEARRKKRNAAAAVK